MTTKLLYSIQAFRLFEVGYALLILVTYRNTIYQEMIDMYENRINIKLLIVVSMLSVGVGGGKLLVGNEEAPRFSD